MNLSCDGDDFKILLMIIVWMIMVCCIFCVRYLNSIMLLISLIDCGEFVMEEKFILSIF